LALKVRKIGYGWTATLMGALQIMWRINA
jgi:hypothetical protein